MLRWLLFSRRRARHVVNIVRVALQFSPKEMQLLHCAFLFIMGVDCAWETGHQ